MATLGDDIGWLCRHGVLKSAAMMIMTGKSDDAIVEFLVTRWGEPHRHGIVHCVRMAHCARETAAAVNRGLGLSECEVPKFPQ